MTAQRASLARVPLGLLLLGGMGIVLLLKLPAVVDAMVASWLLTARVYVVTLAAYTLQQQLRARRRHLGKIAITSTLPVALIFLTCTLAGTLAGLTVPELEQSVAVAFTIGYFNLGAVLFASQMPLDLGARLPDGRRLLGDGKTFGGAAGGLLVATAIGWAAGLAVPLALAVAAGALAGDLAGSVAKRRFRKARGAPVLLLDQLDALLPVLLLEWRWQLLGLSSPALLALAAAIFTFQLTGNYILYRLGKKAVAW